MNCNCITEIEGKVREHMQPQIKAPIDSVEVGNKAIVVEGGRGRMALYVPVFVKANAPRYRSQRGGEVHMHVSFCPFCGKAVKEQS
ncbi:hypothetical protein D3C87_1196370 [compost metagenome]|uniref:Uncharacterized protein n=1 Tax=Achromobacter phage vB_AchrS_AchV4 TaxID=2796514 RepID=A0A7T3PGY5_9CAUD|nr:hypothetical protein JT316_gp41 [Achromobacter phage vB_AchrS_AchV4]QPZ53298.1 hypothetical protein AchV4_0041 [Achromobacter phage vB_AchrS_AchV4]